MNKLFQTVALRYQAIFVPKNSENADLNPKEVELKGITSVFAANLSKLGFGLSQKLLEALNLSKPIFLAELLEQFKEVMGVNKNWTPLVKGWNVPTGETEVDHIMTFFANVFGAKGTKLTCGHVIPAGTFPLERYNGCPFCGTPFEVGKLELHAQGSKLKVLDLWTKQDINKVFVDLLTSKTALDATQMDSLKLLLSALPLPEVQIGMKETLMAVIDICLAQNQAEKVQNIFASPNDILRYLWFKHTGFLQIIEPKTIVKRHEKNGKNLATWLNNSGRAKTNAKQALKLKYNRKMCFTVAKWLNNLPMDSEKICEIMHPKRGMWVRFIRALRLAEYSKRKGLEKLNEILDVFYKGEYTVWQGRVQYFRLRSDQENTFKLLKQRPGLFARSLFANMLWFGAKQTVEAFAEVIEKVPARLVFTLNMYAQNYFCKTARVVKPLGGVAKNVPMHPLLSLFDDNQLAEMKSEVENLTLVAVKKRFASQVTESKTIYIDPYLFHVPIAIGDRSENVQDLPSALMGTRFEVLGDKIRLFMQWGTGLHAQHLDMDLSCHIAYEKRNAICSYSNLQATGCKHSGDIRSIPNKVGTAEYIEIDVQALKKAQAKYVAFTCNAYSNGAITPNLVLGWMDSKFPMKISETSGVAYDPSCVQQQVRITSSVTKGLVFGVLDVQKNEVVWLEMPFDGQVVQALDVRNIEAILAKLNSKLSVGNILKIKAEAQNLQVLESISETETADEIYNQEWVRNTAAVTKLLLDE